MTTYIQLGEKEVCFEYKETSIGDESSLYSDIDGLQYECGETDYKIITVTNCYYTGEDDYGSEINEIFIEKFQESFNDDSIKFEYNF